MWLAMVAACAAGDVWAPTTVPFDPTCSRCESIGFGELGHGGDVQLFVDRETDDPVAQWAACTTEVIGCVEVVGDDELGACGELDACPRDCHRAFRRGLDGDAVPDVLDAIEATYFAAEGLCGPPRVLDREGF